MVEAAEALGASPAQILFKVEIPNALGTILLGINQTVMMALAMVTYASMIGVGGLGRLVLQGIGRLDMGLADGRRPRHRRARHPVQPGCSSPNHATAPSARPWLASPYALVWAVLPPPRAHPQAGALLRRHARIHGDQNSCVGSAKSPLALLALALPLGPALAQAPQPGHGVSVKLTYDTTAESLFQTEVVAIGLPSWATTCRPSSRWKSRRCTCRRRPATSI